MSELPQLFHAIADAGSAKVRRWVVAQAQEPRVRLRNVAYDEVRADLAAAGGGAVPALLLDGRLVVGADEVIAALEARRG